MTGAAAGGHSTAAHSTVDVGPSSVLCLHALKVTPQAGSFVVGRADTGRFVALPEVGVAVLELLAAGQTVAQATLAVTPPSASEPVDVLAFARSLVRLGFVRTVDDCAAPGLPERLSGVGVAVRPRLRWLFSRPTAIAAASCALGALVLMTTLPAVRPDVGRAQPENAEQHDDVKAKTGQQRADPLAWWQRPQPGEIGLERQEVESASDPQPGRDA